MEMPCSAVFRIFWTFRRVAGVRCLLTKLCRVPFKSIPEQTNTHDIACLVSVVIKYYEGFLGNIILLCKEGPLLQQGPEYPPTKHIKALSVSWLSINSGSLESCWCKLTQTLYVCVCVCVLESAHGKSVFPAFIYRYLTWSILICLFCRDNHYIKNIKTVGDR